MPSTITPGMPYPAARSTMSLITIALPRRRVLAVHVVLAHEHDRQVQVPQAMLVASWKAPMLVDASPKNATDT